MPESGHIIDRMDPEIAIVIPTYQREAVLVETIRHLLCLPTPADELIVVDQTVRHEASTRIALQTLQDQGAIRWLQLAQPSIPAAMNVGLLAAKSRIVLFLDDDIEPDPALVEAHRNAQLRSPGLIAGQVLQPGERPVPLADGETFRFNSTDLASICEFMGGNFSIIRNRAISVGGFDENFVGAAFRFEAEFSHRYILAYGDIVYEPSACIQHLRVTSGGTRSYGNHLQTINSAHSVGAYYYLLSVRPRHWFWKIVWRPLRAVRTSYHLRRPWWIPLTLFAELRGFVRAVGLARKGPVYISSVASSF